MSADLTVFKEHTVAEMKEMATAYHASGLFGFTKPEQYFVLMCKAQARKQHPATVVDDYHFFNGKASPKAETILQWHLASGGKVEWLQSSATVCEAKFWLGEGAPFTAKWTIEDAAKAGLTGKDNWKKFPEDMLAARVIGRGVKRVNPAALKGERVLEEIYDEPNEAAAPTAVSAPAPSIPRASAVAAQEGEFTEAPKAAEAPPESAVEAKSPVPAAPATPPTAAPKAPAAPATQPPPANALYLKEVPTQVMHRDDPSVGKVRYGITLSIGLVGTYSKEAAEAAAAAAANKTMIELAYTVADIGGGKTRNELVWLNGKAVAG